MRRRLRQVKEHDGFDRAIIWIDHAGVGEGWVRISLEVTAGLQTSFKARRTREVCARTWAVVKEIRWQMFINVDGDASFSISIASDVCALSNPLSNPFV